MTSIDEYPKPTLLTLGGSALAAVAVGLLYGSNQRVWCRYLCPSSGVFGLLAKVAPLHFAVERERRALLNINLSFRPTRVRSAAIW